MRPAAVPPDGSPPRGAILAAVAGLILAALAAYHNSFAVPFVFDDIPAITANPTIRQLWPIGRVLSPPADGGLTIGGRPLVNLSLAINYAISGTDVWSYHAGNLAIHILAALALFGIVRRTLLLKSGKRMLKGEGRRAEGGDTESDISQNPTFFAFAVALLWTVHPLQTESVTYVVQRAESLMGLFYLLTLYFFIHRVELETDEVRKPLSPFALRLSPFWSGLCITACLLGMAAKEVMVSAPVVVFLYDRTFVAGTFRAAWRLRWRLYLGLAATWLPLAILVFSTNHRGGTAGFGVGLAWWKYALTQCRAIVLYLRLSVWPHPLVFDYGSVVATGAATIVFSVLAVAVLLGATIIGLRRRSPAGFLGAWLFAILAPTALVPVATQTIAEHRMYLPLAAVIAAVVLIVERISFRLSAFRLPLFAFFFLVLAAGLGVLTVRRNGDYRSALAIWSDTARKSPDNARAFYNLGNSWRDLGQPGAAIAPYEQALALQPDFAEAHNNLASVLVQANRSAEAIGHFRRSIALSPEVAEPHYNLGNVLASLGRREAAVAQYEEALRIDPALAEAEINLGHTLLELNRLAEAAIHYEAAARLRPGDPDARHNADLLREYLRAHPGEAAPP